MTAPLLSNGKDYPCKGYNTPEAIARLNSVATLEAGKGFNVTLTGTATHGGGSCQFALSYDGGATFAVITSIVGGCPLAEAYTIDVPAAVPAGKKVIFLWNWFSACSLSARDWALLTESQTRSVTASRTRTVPSSTSSARPTPGPRLLSTAPTPSPTARASRFLVKIWSTPTRALTSSTAVPATRRAPRRSSARARSTRTRW